MEVLLMRTALVLLFGIAAVFGLGLLVGLAGQDPPKRITVDRTVSTVVIPPDCQAAIAAAGDVIAHSSETITAATNVIAAETAAIKLIGEALLTPVGPNTMTASQQISTLQDTVRNESLQLSARKPELDEATSRFTRAATNCR